MSREAPEHNEVSAADRKPADHIKPPGKLEG